MAQPPAAEPNVHARWRQSLEDDAERRRLAQLLTAGEMARGRPASPWRPPPPEDDAERHRLAQLLTKAPAFARAPESFRLAVVDMSP